MKRFFLFLCVPLTNAAPLTLDAKLSWSGNNKAKLEQFLSKNITEPHPVAVFDWDNTVIKNDIGDATFFWMLANNKIHRPESWKNTSSFLTEAAVKELNQNCPLSSGDPIPTSQLPLCADSMLSFYVNETLIDSSTPAWKKNDHPDTVLPSYSWIVHLMQGYRPEDIRTFAAAALAFNLKNRIGATQRIGSKNYIAYIRYYPQMKNFLTLLKKRGFDVWIVSASTQYVVEVAAGRLGIDAQHVIGVRPELDHLGLLTTTLQACGTHPDHNQSLITYRQGKRCWINKVIFHLSKPLEQMETPSPISFAAGDSDTDVFFLKDAREGHLVINRNKTEIMCNALNNKDQKWIINPMFLEPLALRRKPYECLAFGLKNQKER